MHTSGVNRMLSIGIVNTVPPHYHFSSARHSPPSRSITPEVAHIMNEPVVMLALTISITLIELALIIYL